MEEVGRWEVTEYTGNLSIHVESSVNMSRRLFFIGCLSVGITEHSRKVVIPLGVFPVWRDIMSKLVLCTLALKSDMLLNMMLVSMLWLYCQPCY